VLSVQTLVRRIRQRLHDTDKITYDDEEIIDCINNGIRFIRRVVASINPALLMSEHQGILTTGLESITLTVRPTKIINVTIGDEGKPLYQTEMSLAIHEGIYETGEPKSFFLTGAKTVHFYPKPATNTKYVIRTIDDVEEIGAEDSSPLNNEFDDFLIDYVVIRLSVGNEYDMTQENTLMANIVAQIQQLVMPPPCGVIVDSYWDSQGRRRSGGYR